MEDLSREQATPLATQKPGENDIADLENSLRRTIAKICPPWLRDEADDLVQNSLVRVLEIQKKTEGTTHFNASYLWKVAHSALIDEIRRRQRLPFIPFPETDDGPAEHAPDPESAAEGRDLDRAIGICLTAIIPKRRTAVTLYLQGHKTVEIANLMQWTPKRAENLAHRGLRQLRDCLTKKGWHPWT